MGAPVTTIPMLEMNGGEDDCFEGMRYYTYKAIAFGQKQVDIVTQGHSRQDGKVHAKMQVTAINTLTWDLDESYCGESAAAMPGFGVPAWRLHPLGVYCQALRQTSDFLDVACHLLKYVSMEPNKTEAFKAINETGWRMLGGAYAESDPNSTINEGGPQVAYLAQDPQTFDCIHTFQGTNSTLDWLADFDQQLSHFCGLDVGVHKGFRDHLRMMLFSDEYQSNIRTQLSQCKKLYVVGHSLGGAMSELFTACVNLAPTPDDDLDGDFIMIGWEANSSNTTSLFLD